jgi:uncharacterized protein (DUF736 family)
MRTTIGKFRKQDGGLFTGQIITLTFTANAMIDPHSEKKSAKSPDYRFAFIHDNSLEREAGSAWRKTSQKGNTYLSVEFDDPLLPASMHCVLVKTPGETNAYDLLWERRRKQRDDNASSASSTNGEF